MDVFPFKLLTLQQWFSAGGNLVSRCQICCFTPAYSPHNSQRRIVDNAESEKPALENIPCSNVVTITKIFWKILVVITYLNILIGGKSSFLGRYILFQTNFHVSEGIQQNIQADIHRHFAYMHIKFTNFFQLSQHLV